MSKWKSASLGDLLGKTITSAVNMDNEEIIFTTNEGEVYKLYHNQDCCENVRVEDIVGDLSDLVGAPILKAEESVSDYSEVSENKTWTFYKFATRLGYVDIRWLGESNGYYSESVDFVKEVKV